MMDDQQPLPLPKPTADQLRIVHQMCERFEKSWRSGQSQTIEQMLTESTKELRPYLLEALVRSEIELLESSGKSIEPRDYVRRFASDSGIIARVFMSPDMLSQIDSGQTLESLTSGPANSRSSPSMSDKPKSLGHFEIREEIARGGMGIVYRGWHEELRREVAVKCIRSSQFVDEEHIERFRRETQTVAALHHDNIVPIYEVGCERQQYYFVMPLIDGQNLSQLTAQSPIAPRELARIMFVAGNVTQFAHDHGVIHRDLKPSNIMVDRQGKVWVADFGLAKSLQPNGIGQPTSSMAGDMTNSEQTTSGALVGTPAYMAPEQLQGRADQLTDVYGLGATLYHGLTGRPPHRAASVLQTLKLIGETEPVSPRTLDPQVPLDLETIALKALSKNPAQRYSTAKEFADDLGRYLEGRPITAKPVSTTERIWRWMKREPVIAGLTFGIMAALAIGMGVSLRYYSLALANERVATNNANMAMASVQEYLTQVADSPELGDQSLEVLRRKLLSSALKYYEQLSQQTPTNVPLQEKLAEAHNRLGMIQTALGEPESATKEFDQMLDGYRSLHLRHPGHAAYLRAIIEALAQRAQLALNQGKLPDVQRDLQEAIELSLPLIQKENDLSDRVMLATLYAKQVDGFTQAGKGDEIKERLGATTKYCEELANSPGGQLTVSSAKRLLRALDQIASQLQNAGDFEATERVCNLGIKLNESAMKAVSKDPQVRYYRSRFHKNLNLLFTRTKRFEEATHEYETCQQLLTDLLKEHPLVFEYLDAEATLMSNYSGMLVMQGKIADAKKIAEETVEIQKQIVSRQPNVSENWNSLANNYATLAVICRNTFQLSDAELMIKSGLQANEKARELAPDSIPAFFYKINLTSSLADAYYAQKRYTEAVELLRPLTSDAQALVAKNPSMNSFATLAASVHRTLASCERKLHHWAEAEKAADEAIAIFETLPKSLVGTGTMPRILTDSLFTKGNCRLSEKDYPGTQATIDRALGVLNPLIDDSQTQPNLAILLRAPRADVYDLEGQVAAATNRLEEAILAYDKAGADQQFVEDNSQNNPTILKLIRELKASTQIHLAQSLRLLNRFDEAIKACDQAIGLNANTAEEAKRLRAEIEEQMEASK